MPALIQAVLAGVVLILNDFARRHTIDSKFSYFDGSTSELLTLVGVHWHTRRSGGKDGIVLVTVPANRFFCGVTEITPQTQLKATFDSRRPGEEPFVQVEAVGGEKLPALVVDIVLYRSDILESDSSRGAEHSPENTWEIISINARPTPGEEPLSPVAMARNFLQLAGGTKNDYSAKDFAESIIYWSKRAMIA